MDFGSTIQQEWARNPALRDAVGSAFNSASRARLIRCFLQSAFDVVRELVLTKPEITPGIRDNCHLTECPVYSTTGVLSLRPFAMVTKLQFWLLLLSKTDRSLFSSVLEQSVYNHTSLSTTNVKSGPSADQILTAEHLTGGVARLQRIVDGLGVFVLEDAKVKLSFALDSVRDLIELAIAPSGKEGAEPVESVNGGEGSCGGAGRVFVVVWRCLVSPHPRLRPSLSAPQPREPSRSAEAGLRAPPRMRFERAGSYHLHLPPQHEPRTSNTHRISSRQGGPHQYVSSLPQKREDS